MNGLFLKNKKVKLKKNIAKCFEAIAIHDEFWNKFEKEEIRKIILKNPLALLLIVCDEIQSWGRDDKNKDLKIDKININEKIEFVFKGPLENTIESLKYFHNIFSKSKNNTSKFDVLDLKSYNLKSSKYIKDVQIEEKVTFEKGISTIMDSKPEDCRAGIIIE